LLETKFCSAQSCPTVRENCVTNKFHAKVLLTSIGRSSIQKLFDLRIESATLKAEEFDILFEKLNKKICHDI